MLSAASFVRRFEGQAIMSLNLYKYSVLVSFGLISIYFMPFKHVIYVYIDI